MLQTMVQEKRAGTVPVIVVRKHVNRQVTVFLCCRTECVDGRQRTSWLIGLTKVAPTNGASSTRRIDIRSTIHDFKGKCETWAGFGADMTLEIKHLLFASLPEYLAVHGRAAAQSQSSQSINQVNQVESPPNAPASAAEQRPLTEQRNGAQPDAPSTAAAQVADTKMESENTENQNKADVQTTSAEQPCSSTRSHEKVDASMQGDEECCAADAGGTDGDAVDLKASVGGGEQASPVGAKRKREEGEGNHRVQRISSHAS